MYWRDPKKTGVVFGSLLVLLLSLALFSVLSVLAYLLLATLTVTISFVVYKKVMAAVQKTNDGHPFKLVKFQLYNSNTSLSTNHQTVANSHLACTFYQSRTKVYNVIIMVTFEIQASI